MSGSLPRAHLFFLWFQSLSTATIMFSSWLLVCTIRASACLRTFSRRLGFKVQFIGLRMAQSLIWRMVRPWLSAAAKRLACLAPSLPGQAIELNSWASYGSWGLEGSRPSGACRPSSRLLLSESGRCGRLLSEGEGHHLLSEGHYLLSEGRHPSSCLLLSESGSSRRLLSERHHLLSEGRRPSSPLGESSMSSPPLGGSSPPLGGPLLTL